MDIIRELNQAPPNKQCQNMVPARSYHLQDADLLNCGSRTPVGSKQFSCIKVFDCEGLESSQMAGHWGLLDTSQNNLNI